MTTTNTYLAIFLGSKDSARAQAFFGLPEAERRKKEQEGMAGWKAWMDKYQSAVLEIGGPLGKTKKISAEGISDISNELGAFTLVRADSHDAAAKMFIDHPHFTIFPGDRVELMPVMPIPAG